MPTSDSKPDSFEVLWTKALDGDEGAVADLIERYSEPIRRTARRLLGRAMRPHVDSVDLIQILQQNVLVGIRTKKITITNPGQFIALINTLLRRSVARQWRVIKRMPREESHEGFTEAIAAAQNSDGEQTVEFSDSLLKFLRSLEPLDQHLLEMRLLGFTTVQVARQLELDPAILRVRLSRLRKRAGKEGWSDEFRRFEKIE